MLGISIREFARRDGCNDKLVRRAIAQKKLIPLDDGSLDPSAVGSGWRKQNRKSADADKAADMSAGVRTITKAGRQQVERPAAPEEPPTESLEEFIAQILKGDFASLADAERIKENALALKHLLDGRKKAGETVEVSTAESILFEEARAARDGWLNFPTRHGSILAAELGIEPERLIEGLTAHVHQHLSDLGEPEADFRDGGRTA